MALPKMRLSLQNKGFPCAENAVFWTQQPEPEMPTTDDYDAHDADWLRDQLRQRDRLIAELRSEKDDASDLIRRLREQAEDVDATFEQWRGAFDMVLSEKGTWSWDPFVKEHWKLLEDYNDLVRRWNTRAIPLLNGVQDVGRPLAASEAQVGTVLKLHKAGKSLRQIEDETSLSLRTVRTIIGRKDGSDRTTKARWQRIDIDKHQRAHWKSQKRTIDALPKRIEAVIETGKALVTEAKGLGRGR